jgi:hypothetical protein
MVSGRARRRSLIQLASGLTLGALVPEPRADAAPLSGDRLDRLLHGELVRERLDLELPQGDYLGGISYALIPAPAADVTRVLHDPATYSAILPMTMEVKVLSQDDRDMRVFFRQGSKLGSAGYVLLVRRESAGLIRFWLDPSQPHEVADLWGYFRVRPYQPRASVLTYAALLRLDPGLVKLLFSETIRRYALSTPGLVRDYVLAH